MNPKLSSLIMHGQGGDSQGQGCVQSESYEQATGSHNQPTYGRPSNRTLQAPIYGTNDRKINSGLSPRFSKLYVWFFRIKIWLCGRFSQSNTHVQVRVQTLQTYSHSMIDNYIFKPDGRKTVSFFLLGSFLEKFYAINELKKNLEKF